MRPVRLDLNGFVSFRDPVTVEFADADYFALVGPTGSGKSTVIDAITFALYGSVHRWDDAKIVKLALAPTATRATVRLLFDIGPTRYVVAREVRRSGATYPHKSRLERLADPSGTGEPDEVTEVLAHDSAVKGAVEQLLGLTFEQFCTCVVLPQGDFAEFLHANRSERQKILLKLLGAAHYDAIARAANSRAANARTPTRLRKPRKRPRDGPTLLPPRRSASRPNSSPPSARPAPRSPMLSVISSPCRRNSGASRPSRYPWTWPISTSRSSTHARTRLRPQPRNVWPATPTRQPGLRSPPRPPVRRFSRRDATMPNTTH